MKVIVKNINVEINELEIFLNSLQVVFYTNRDTHTLINVSEEKYQQIINKKNEFEAREQVILVTRGGL